jgi:DNA-binding NarL/FixJ family response regulator
MTKATKYIREAAERCRASGVTVDIDSRFPTVAIDAPGADGVFMQGDEADTFIEEVRALCKRYPSLDEDTAALALAEPYAENLFC